MGASAFSNNASNRKSPADLNLRGKVCSPDDYEELTTAAASPAAINADFI